MRGRLHRDGVAERRILHGGFGIGPGEKTSANDGRGGEVPFSESLFMEEAADEAMNMSVGAVCHARRILEGIGWKEGEALGNNTRGLKEPLQAVGNKGCVGLRWNNHDRL
ncbi:SUPPRESSOR OF ABI3-5-like isoform X2 [Magnolia sinica]|uniref:SUPPRESSOR OF ABI3-5-like isoform X2 n=1 Tax=Magnolia sinica TaxID=86752 RepID=UPI00265AF18B|nr:SUPPRESSOR OF ABI3-5-like isoform X2 [Magnolia sinica]XP_058077945.1 SUPPRESSOR OF ABI3-5-like isoform X2 [Magnolia sinica]